MDMYLFGGMAAMFLSSDHPPGPKRPTKLYVFRNQSQLSILGALCKLLPKPNVRHSSGDKNPEGYRTKLFDLPGSMQSHFWPNHAQSKDPIGRIGIIGVECA